MRTIFLLIVFALAASGCKKCLKCENKCTVCHDQHFTIKVCSDKLTFRYYQEYIDSLQTPGLGWVCKDTTSNISYERCSSDKLSDDKSQKEDQGYSCTIH